jgi:DNA replication protein DnaD
MPLFEFDEQYPLFDATPVENLFVQEYLPAAKGDYVKVYLYGLMHTYHPTAGMNLAMMARDLGLNEEDVLSAYRYWERKGLVQRTADNPPAFRYMNAKQLLFMRQCPTEDKQYTQFADALYAAFGEDRQLHGQETSLAYEWIEDLKLPPEVVLMLVQHLISTRGKHFSFKAAQKMAVQLAEEKVHTIEDAEIVLSRSKAVLEGTRKILRRLGKRHQPSEDEMALYHKWTMDWGYDHDAIEAACRETTKGDPTMAYLDGILNGLRKRCEKTPASAKQVESQLQKEQDEAAPLKELFRALGISGLTVNEGTLCVYRQMRDVASHDVILLAAREAARFGGRLDDVLRLLTTWHDKGLTSTRQVEEYIAAFYESNRLLAQLFEQCGKSEKPTASDRSLLAKWQKDWSFSTDLLILAASLSQTADKKMPYMDAMLRAWHEQGISTPEAAQAARERFEKAPAAATAAPQRHGKVVTAQLYTQRTYDEIDLNKWAASMIEEAKESDA